MKNNVLQTIIPTTKDWATRTPLKSGGKLRYSWWVSSFCSTSDTHRVTLVRNQVINHEWGKNRIVITTKETLPWSFVSLITSTWSLGTFGSVPTLLETNLYPGRDRCGRDRMVSGFTTKCALMPITTKVESSNPVHGELYSYNIMWYSLLAQVGGFLRVLRFPPPIYSWNIVESVDKHHKPNHLSRKSW
jgi:hypothetical protein